MATKRKWSREVTEHSNAMDLDKDVFTLNDPHRIAESLKHSSETSHRRRGRSAFQSAMSMLNFYVNRAGKNLPEERKKVMEDAKAELREVFGKPAQPSNKQ